MTQGETQTWVNGKRGSAFQIPQNTKFPQFHRALTMVYDLHCPLDSLHCSTTLAEGV